MLQVNLKFLLLVSMNHFKDLKTLSLAVIQNTIINYVITIQITRTFTECLQEFVFPFLRKVQMKY